MKGFDVKSFAGDTPPQFVKEGSKPTKVPHDEKDYADLYYMHPCVLLFAHITNLSAICNVFCQLTVPTSTQPTCCTRTWP
jgi:hypothetical protein